MCKFIVFMTIVFFPLENRKSADGRRPNSAGAVREPIELARKRQELVEKERLRRDAIKKKVKFIKGK